MQQEILIILNSSFADSQLNDNNEGESKNFSQEEHLQHACANGLIKDLLPEIFKYQYLDKTYLWQMRPGFSFLQLEFGESPLELETSTSINPHNFLATCCYN